MNRISSYAAIAVYSIFLGSQITEGCLLVPYWKTLSAMEFHEYYSIFGLRIGRFYTILTVIAVFLPTSISIYCFAKKSQALNYSLLSTFSSFMVIVLFYAYFKDANQQFYDANLSATQLQSELVTWEYLHWTRVLFEFLSLSFLTLTFNNLNSNSTNSHTHKTV